MDVPLQSVKKPVLIKKQITPYKRPVFLRIFCVSYFCNVSLRSSRVLKNWTQCTGQSGHKRHNGGLRVSE